MLILKLVQRMSLSSKRNSLMMSKRRSLVQVPFITHTYRCIELAALLLEPQFKFLENDKQYQKIQLPLKLSTLSHYYSQHLLQTNRDQRYYYNTHAILYTFAQFHDAPWLKNQILGFFFPFLGMEFQQRHHQITNISTNQRNNPRNNKTITMRSEGIELDRNGFTNHTKATHVDLTI